MPDMEPGSPAGAPWGPRWLCGDLHTHTHHSDAQGFSVADLIDAARDAGLDFVFVTDHNTNAGLRGLESVPGRRVDPDLIVGGGIELTTFWGHALCLGAREWIDWRVDPGGGAMGAIADAVADEGQLFIIAHPLADGDPDCTGCAWRFSEMMPGNARLVEVWNGPWDCDSNNEANLALWYDWLNQGRRLVATAGSDIHSAGDYGRRPGFSVVRAAAPTEAGILAGVKAGHVVLSSGPELRLHARNGAGRRRTAGDTVYGPATVTARWSDCPAGARVGLVAHGRLMTVEEARGSGERSWELTPAEAAWIAVEIRAADGEMLALTNPIYLEPPSSSGSSIPRPPGA
jgi:hypothetical protein